LDVQHVGDALAERHELEVEQLARDPALVTWATTRAAASASAL
jgi:hypothetical protein